MFLYCSITNQLVLDNEWSFVIVRAILLPVHKGCGQDTNNDKVQNVCPVKSLIHESTVTAKLLWSFLHHKWLPSECRWPRGLRSGFTAVHLLGLRVRILWGGWMSLVSVVCCQVGVSASGWSIVQRSPTDCLCVSLSVIRGNNNLEPFNELVEKVRIKVTSNH